MSSYPMEEELTVTSSSCSWSLTGYNLDERAVRSSSWLQPSLTPEGVCIKSAPASINTHIDVALMWLPYLSGLGISYWCGNRVCVCPLSFTHTHTHTNSTCLPHSVIWSPARGLANKPVCTHDVCPLQTWAAVKRLRSSPSSQQKWNTVVVELFPNTPMIHTCSARFPRMPLCMPHCAEVLALANIVSVDYSFLHWGNIPHCVHLCVCGCAVLIAQTVMACFSSATVEQAVVTQCCCSYRIKISCRVQHLVCWAFQSLQGSFYYQSVSKVLSQFLSFES